MEFWLSSVTHLLLAAQAATTPVVGIVRDADSGTPLAHAKVSSSSLPRTVLTDESGRYTFDAPPGIEHVTVVRVGYTPQSFDAIVPAAGPLEINVALRREPIMLPPIEVRAPVPIRGFDSSPLVDFPDRTVSQSAMYEYPLSPEPDALRSLGGGEVMMDPEAPSGIHIRGGASDQVSYLLDGIPVFSPYRTGGTFGSWNPDALAGVDLIAAAPLHVAPEALSGVVYAHTRAPGARFGSRGSVSATQARATIDGPLGGSGAGYVVSVGSAFPGLVVHKNESSHMQGDNVDWLGKVEAPLLGGHTRLLGYGSETQIDVASVAETDTVPVNPARNTLAWDGRSFGAEWGRSLGDRAALTLRAWSATGHADATWIGPDSLETLTSNRRDDGAVAAFDFAGLGGHTTVGARVQNIETAYSLRPSSASGRALSFDGATPVATVFLEHQRPVTSRATVDVSLASASVAAETYFSPNAQVEWRAARTMVVSATAARRYQFAQSLRNAESVVSNVFPADLYIGAGASGLPAASSDIGIIAFEHRPNAWLRFGAQGYVRDFESLALIAPRTADPYANDGFVVGSGESHGASFEAGVSREHYGLLASYAFQHVELRYGDGTYAPSYSATHTVQCGVVYSPSSSYDFRLGFQGIAGRRTTAALGTFEWEACNMVDGGCEFAGSPSEWSGALGGTGLPAYFRLDLGVRRQWDVNLGGRQGQIALFGTATNLLARHNVLTVAVDPATGQRSNVDMLPPAPVVVGVDWRF